MSGRLKLSLGLEMLYRDRPFIDRLKEAARLGYQAIEFWDWRDKDIDGIKRETDRLGLSVAAISGNRRHSLIEPSDRAGLMTEMEQVLEIAARLNCHHIMMLSDVLNADGSAATSNHSRSIAEKQASIREGLADLVRRVEGKDLVLLLEPLNTVLDHRGCFLDSSCAGVEAVQVVNHAQVRLLYDVYHMSMMGEDAVAEVKKQMPWIGYFHAADVPGRHEPGSGTIPWPAIRGVIERAGYPGFVGMEFSALGSDDEAARRSLDVFSQ
jgi:hydroxypyruvate isomerase